MLPIADNSAQFRDDQTVAFAATYWDTTMTVPQQGMGFVLFDLLDPTFDLLSTSNANRANLEAVLNSSTVRPVLGKDALGTYKSGVAAVMQNYWGAGAPAGCKVAKRVMLKYHGTVPKQPDGTNYTARPVTLVFGGQGKIRAFKNGTSLASGRVKEVVLSQAPTTPDEAGYVIIETTLASDDVVEIYYAHNGEPWGGVVGKVIDGTGHLANGKIDWATFREALRDAPVISSSLLSLGPVEGKDVPYIESALVEASEGRVRTLTFEVALNAFGEPNGFTIEHVGGQTQLMDNADSSMILRPGRLIHFEGGFNGGYEELYPRFTGRITSIVPSGSGETASVQCHGFENAMAGVFDENYPDKLSYIAAGFIDREWLGWPVFDVPAMDAWPLQAALAECLSRSGIDSANFGRNVLEPTEGRWQLQKALSGAVVLGEKKFKATSLSDSTQLLTLQRHQNYGNVGPLRKDYLPTDDGYLYPSNLSDRLFDRAMELASQYGYDFYFDERGQAVIGSRNNPEVWEYLSTQGNNELVNPSAVGGRYYRNTTSSGGEWTKQFVVTASRVDLYVGVGQESDVAALNGGLVKVDIDVKDPSGSWIALTNKSKTFSTFQAGRAEAFFYDDLLRQDGSNVCAVTLFNLPFDEYRVTLTPMGPDLADGNSTAVVRLNGYAVFSRDPSTPALPEKLSTLENLLDLRPQSNEQDLRNQIIVVGQRKAAVTDSAKFSEDNPNNPYAEFFVSVAADPQSMYDPQAANFVGGKRVAVIVDEKVTDGDFAKWLARTALYRHNMPKLSFEVEHTALPVLELRDPVHVVDGSDPTIQHVTWVTSIREQWTMEGATSEISLSAYPELPSYSPREDVDISLFENAPAYRITASYKNVLGQQVQNADGTLPIKMVRASRGTAGGSLVLDYKTVADDLSIEGEGGQAMLVNHPYSHFWTRTGSTGTGASRQTTVAFDPQVGDGTAGVYDANGYSLSSKLVYADEFVPRTGLNPFYDPYSSEVGNLVSVRFDSLVSGFYRVSLWAASEKGGHAFPVAWLTKPEADGLSEDAHWAYLDAGAGREFLWDGVDNIGLWNRYQSRDYARQMEGSFLDETNLSVGRGFYAWNDESSSVSTQIGDAVDANFGPDGQPYFTKGRFSRFYVKIEAKSDRALRATRQKEPLTVNSHDDLKGIANPFYIYTHLGEPTQVHVTLYDWNEANGTWLPTTTGGLWSSVPDATASIRNGKPVKMTFQPVARRGVMFHGENGSPDDEKTSVQLTRTAHLKVTTFDQFWSYTGAPWGGDLHEKNKATNNAANKEAKRLTSRMHSDDTHTVNYTNSAWLTGRDLKFYEWVFQPEFFKRDFGNGEEEVRYCDYEQLYSLPGYDTKQGGGTARSDKAFIMAAWQSFTFFLSAMTLDRSGRRQWCLNPKFIDKSKIVTSTWRGATYSSHPQYAVHYERHGADKLLARSIFARQWIEPGWVTGATDGSPVSAQHSGTGGISNSFQMQWVQLPITRFDPFGNYWSAARGGVEDQWARASTLSNQQIAKDFWGEHWNSTRINNVQLRFNIVEPHEYNYRIPNFGNWTFDRYIYPNWYQPCPPRDFHPYWRAGMPHWPDSVTNVVPGPATIGMGTTVNAWQSPSSFNATFVRDYARQSNWFGFAYANNRSDGNLFYRGARLEVDVLSRAKEGDLGADMGTIFDYVRQDTLHRFDHFRGVIGKAPYAKAKDFLFNSTMNWWSAGENFQAGAAPVKPSGTYLMNLGRYTDYTMGPATFPQWREDHNYLHMTSGITGWYDYRFRHEYVWYNQRYFPVHQKGGQQYALFQEERTTIGATSTPSLLYDSGAWTGWKDDVESGQWNNDPHLRWMELFSSLSDVASQNISVLANLWRDGSNVRPFVGGGYGGGAWPATGRAKVQQSVLGSSTQWWVQRANIFSDTFASNRMRLAVGPRTPESVELVMNLTLPTRYAR